MEFITSSEVEGFVTVNYPDGFNRGNARMLSYIINFESMGTMIPQTSGFIDIQFRGSYIQVYTKESDAAEKACIIDLYKWQ